MHKRAKCPKCGKYADRRGAWRNLDGSYYRMYVHKTEKRGAFVVITKYCMVKEVRSK